MTTDLTTFIGMVRRDLRDEADPPTFTDDELTDLIVAGISELASFYPKEVVSSVTIASSAWSYALPDDITWVFRVERYDSDDTYLETMQESGSGQREGWQVHAGTLFIPPNYCTDGDVLKLWGYGPWNNYDFAGPSSGTDYWYSSGDSYSDYASTGVPIGDVLDGDVFVYWGNVPPQVTGTACTIDAIVANASYRIHFTEAGTDVYVVSAGGDDNPWCIMHKVAGGIGDFVLIGD
jgi:hypothetical protein